MKASFGRYVLLKKIAVGGMAEIFLARRLSFGGFAKFVVIKRLLPEHQGRKAFEQLFLAEARITAVLNHPNIINLHDLGKLDDAYFMAMEYVHGASVAEVMALAGKKQVRIPLEVALHIVRCTADALHYSDVTEDLDGQPLRVIHHDVSPHNIQVSFEGEVKLLDYGVATRVGHPAPGGRRGKYAYMSPEAIERREPLDPRSDLYSLGVCLFELALGKRLFKGNNPEDTRQRAVAGRIPAPSQVQPGFPPILEPIILRALARDPEQRYPNGKALSEDLTRVAEALNLDLSVRRMQAFMTELHVDTLDRRREELLELARASTPRRGPEALPEAEAPAQGPAAASGAPSARSPAAAAAPPLPPPAASALGALPPLPGRARAASPLATRGTGVAATAPASAPAPVAAALPTEGADPTAGEADAGDPLEDGDDPGASGDRLDALAVLDAAPGLRVAGTLAPEGSLAEAVRQAGPADERTPSPVDDAPLSGSDLALVRAAAREAAADPVLTPARSMVELTDLPVGANDDDDDWDAALAAPLSKWRRLSLWIALLGLALAAGAFFAGQNLGLRGIGSLGDLKTGTVRLESDPPGTQVFDGRTLLGTTPFQTAPLPFGTRLGLRFVRPGYDEYQVSVTLSAERRNPTVSAALRRNRL